MHIVAVRPSSKTTHLPLVTTSHGTPSETVSPEKKNLSSYRNKLLWMGALNQSLFGRCLWPVITIQLSTNHKCFSDCEMVRSLDDTSCPAALHWSPPKAREYWNCRQPIGRGDGSSCCWSTSAADVIPKKVMKRYGRWWNHLVVERWPIYTNDLHMCITWFEMWMCWCHQCSSGPLRLLPSVNC